MSKGKKLATILILIALILTVAVVGIVLIIQNNNREKTPSTVMTCSVNPSIQFVINENNKVMNVTATNTDGEALIAKVDFVGMKAEEAAELFVEISTKAGFINVNTEGTVVEINLDGVLEDYSKLKDSITARVNRFFDENGIIAGAVTSVTEDLKEYLENISVETKNYANMTKEELITEYSKMAERLKGISLEKYAELEIKYLDLKAVLDEATSISSTLFNTYKVTLSSFETMLNTMFATQPSIIEMYQPLFDIAEATTAEELEIAINDAKDLLDEIPAGIKQTVNNLLDSAISIYENMKQTIDEAKAAFEENYNEFIKQMQDQSKSLLESLKSQLDDLIEESNAAFEARKEYFEQNKESVQSQINAFRESLKQA